MLGTKKLKVCVVQYCDRRCRRIQSMSGTMGNRKITSSPTLEMAPIPPTSTGPPNATLWGAAGRVRPRRPSLTVSHKSCPFVEGPFNPSRRGPCWLASTVVLVSEQWKTFVWEGESWEDTAECDIQEVIARGKCIQLPSIIESSLRN